MKILNYNIIILNNKHKYRPRKNCYRFDLEFLHVTGLYVNYYYFMNEVLLIIIFKVEMTALYA